MATTEKVRRRKEDTTITPSETHQDHESTQFLSSAIFQGITTGFGTLIALIFGIFTILAWQTSVEAQKAADLQNKVAMIQYCAGAVPIGISSFCDKVNGQAVTQLPDIALSILGSPGVGYASLFPSLVVVSTTTATIVSRTTSIFTGIRTEGSGTSPTVITSTLENTRTVTSTLGLTTPTQDAPPDSAGASSRLSQSAKIGIGVGIGIGVVSILVGVATCYYARARAYHSRRLGWQLQADQIRIPGPSMVPE